MRQQLRWWCGRSGDRRQCECGCDVVGDGRYPEDAQLDHLPRVGEYSEVTELRCGDFSLLSTSTIYPPSPSDYQPSTISRDGARLALTDLREHVLPLGCAAGVVVAGFPRLRRAPPTSSGAPPRRGGPGEATLRLGRHRHRVRSGRGGDFGRIPTRHRSLVLSAGVCRVLA